MSYVIVTESCDLEEGCDDTHLSYRCDGCMYAATGVQGRIVGDPIPVRRSGFALFRGRQESRYGKNPTDAVPAKLIPEANAQPHTPIVWIET